MAACCQLGAGSYRSHPCCGRGVGMWLNLRLSSSSFGVCLGVLRLTCCDFTELCVDATFSPQQSSGILSKLHLWQLLAVKITSMYVKIPCFVFFFNHWMVTVINQLFSSACFYVTFLVAVFPHNELSQFLERW